MREKLRDSVGGGHQNAKAHDLLALSSLPPTQLGCGGLIVRADAWRSALVGTGGYAKAQALNGFFDVTKLGGRFGRQRQFEPLCGDVQDRKSTRLNSSH